MPSEADATPPTVRIGTLNVHGWDNLDAMIAMLHHADLDVIGLQEAPNQNLPAVARALGKKSAGAHQYEYVHLHCCAILSRLRIVDSNTRGKRERDKRADRVRHVRALLELRGGGTLDVACVHLDHVREPNRLSQLATLAASFDKRRPDCIIGDFNALTRSDYSRAEWDRIADVRARNAWEPPQTHLTCQMTTPAGQKVAVGRANTTDRGLGYVDARLAARAQLGPRTTCRFDTRIDYVYVDAAALASAEIVSCEHVVAIPHVSDHNLVIAALGSWGAGASVS